MRKLLQRLVAKMESIRRRKKYESIYRKFRDFTMIQKSTYAANLALTERYFAIPGAIVECGTWKGGMIGGMAYLLGSHRTYFLFDSFEGLPPAQEIDGESALNWQADTDSTGYFDNCKASIFDVKTAMSLAEVRNSIIEKGWFQDTLPNAVFPEGISILRLDADWYESTLLVLENLFSKVNKGGVIIIDDYHTWDGCSKAVHDYLSRNQCVERINAHGGVCFIEKG